MTCTSKLEIPEDGNDVLDDVFDDVLDVKQFWQKGYALPVGDFNMLICISWNRNIKRKMLKFNYTKLWFYVQIKYFIEDHCTDQAQKTENVVCCQFNFCHLYLSILLINVSLSYNSSISFDIASPHM